MPPVSIKSHEIINGLWFSQGLLITIIIAAMVTLPWHVSVWVLVLLPVIYYNARKIAIPASWSLILNQDNQFFTVIDEQVESAELLDYWHISRYLWLMIESSQTKQYCLIKRSRVGASRYARLLMGLKPEKHEQK